MVTRGEGPDVDLVAMWVSVSDGLMWGVSLGGPGYQVGKCQEWLHVARGLMWTWLPSG